MNARKPERLYCAQDVAQLLGVGASAFTMSRRRAGAGILRQLPAPAFTYGDNAHPLWTWQQLSAFVDERYASARSTLDTATDHVYR